ncbi:MAG: hypothetical protein GC151_10055 [Betaproteobacteria bacterium]|nr:hypothetical protein [Betaproteobacteria bacterium]
MTGRSDAARIRSLERLVDVSGNDSGAIDIHLVPYLGEASQGNTRRRLRRIFVGEWSDKSSHARRPPEKFQLTESPPFRTGSLSRTIAHELGHALGLKHPNKSTQTTFGLLMGGRRPGYLLTPSEIAIARRHAADLTQ